MKTLTMGGSIFAVEHLDRDEEARFRAWHGLPDPSLGYFTRNGITTDELLASRLVDGAVIALLKQLANAGEIDDQLLVDTFACALFCDDGSYTAYNSLVLLEYFTRNNISYGLTANHFASAVSGLSFHNGPAGNNGMHRLSDPEEIEGAAAVVRFVGVMNRGGLVRNTVLQHPGSNGRRELAIINRYLDRLLRLNPDAFDTACSFLRENKITITRKSVQPLVERLEAEGMTVRGMEPV